MWDNITEIAAADVIISRWWKRVSIFYWFEIVYTVVSSIYQRAATATIT